MITRLREVRRARRMTLQDVAARCGPPTTPQTIGRLETGARTVSVGWLNRIAAGARASTPPISSPCPSARTFRSPATLDHDGAHAPRREGVVLPPQAAPGLVAMVVQAGHRRLSQRRRDLAAAAGARGVRARAQPRPARPPPRRPLPVRPADRARGPQAPSPPAGRRPAPDGRRRPGLGRNGGEADPDTLGPRHGPPSPRPGGQPSLSPAGSPAGASHGGR